MYGFENIEDIIVKSGKVTYDQLKKAVNNNRNEGKSLEEILVEANIISEGELLYLLSLSLNIKYRSINSGSIDPGMARYIQPSLAHKYHLAPIGFSHDKLTVAMAYPFNSYALDDISFASGMNIEPVLTERYQVDNIIEMLYQGVNRLESIAGSVDNTVSSDDLDSAPAVSMFNTIILRALRARASDIHIEPFGEYVRVRFRIDGELREDIKPVKNSQLKLISRIKILSNLNIAEKRVPQEGRIFINIEGEDYDLRVSIIPIAHGEKAAIRILKRKNFLMSREELGFKKADLEKIESMIGMHYGIILITGPTGSGKSTTLYTLLNELNTVKRNIVTIEDPVEYMIEGINQIGVNNKLGLTFAAGLRTVLRQDPDVIMIGEIRDQETAEIAIRAAITGHLVFSTMHTNDALSSIIRLIDMGVQPYLIPSALIGSIAQRLVKRICVQCKYSYTADFHEKFILGADNDQELILYKGKGCSACGYTGYFSRIAIYEIINFNGENKKILSDGINSNNISIIAEKIGLMTLKQNCTNLVKAGVTTVEELMRVIYN